MFRPGGLPRTVESVHYPRDWYFTIKGFGLVSSRFNDKQNKLGLRPIGGAIEAALRELGLDERFQERELLGAWAPAVGPDIAAHVQAVDVEDGVLILVADHGAWRQEVNMLAPKILEKINEEHGPDTISALRWSNRPGVSRRKKRF